MFLHVQRNCSLIRSLEINPHMARSRLHLGVGSWPVDLPLVLYIVIVSDKLGGGVI